MEKYCRAGQATDDNLVHVHCMLETKGYKQTLRIYNAYCFSGAWGSVVVKALRYYRTVPGSIPGGVTGFFSVALSDGTMCPGVNSAPDNEYQ